MNKDKITTLLEGLRPEIKDICWDIAWHAADSALGKEHDKTWHPGQGAKEIESLFKSTLETTYQLGRESALKEAIERISPMEGRLEIYKVGIKDAVSVLEKLKSE